jgi:hypothetical protein
MNTSIISKKQKSKIDLIEGNRVDYYQRDADGFFCLSEVCEELERQCIEFFKDLNTKVLIIQLYPDRQFPNKVTLNTIIAIYPELIKHQRNRQSLNTGIWIQSNLLKAFIPWAERAKKQNWSKYLVPDLKFDNWHEAGLSFYPYQSKNSDIIECYIEPESNFVTDAATIKEGYKAFRLLTSDVKFILALEQVAQGDRESFESENYTAQKKVFWSYRELFKVIEIKGTKILFIHPEVRQLYSNNLEYTKIIQNHQQLQKEQCCLTYVESAPYSTFRKDLKAIASPACHTQIWQTHKDIGLKITEQKYFWQFTLDLISGKVYIMPEFLGLYGWKKASNLRYPTKEDIMSNFELETDSVETIMYKGIALDVLNINQLERNDDCELLFNFENEKHRVMLPTSFGLTLKHTLNIYQELIDSDNPLEKVCELGYVNPFKNNIIALDPNIRTIQIGNISVRQRMSDGFINANDMAQPFSLNVKDWLRLDSTWNLFTAMERKKTVNVTWAKKPKQTNTRIANAFPTLIERKQGNKYEGGTWIEPHLAINLAQWLDGEFAVEATFILVDYFKQQSSVNKLPGVN